MSEGHEGRGLPKALLWGGVAAAGLAVVGALAGLIIWALGSAPPEPLSSVVQGPLPSKVHFVGQSASLNENDDMDTPPALDRSFLARVLCGGQDVAQRLLDAKGKPLKDLGPRVLDLLANDDVAPAMKCAVDLYDRIDERAMVALKFKDPDDEERQVVLMAAHFDELPMKKHAFRGLSGYCEKDESSDACAKDGVAAVPLEGVWAAGPLAAIEAFTREWTAERETATTNVQIARDLTLALEPAHEVRVFIKPDHVTLSHPCFVAAPGDALLPFSNHCWPDDVQHLAKSITAETRGYAILQDHPARSGTFRSVHVLLARDERGAEDIVRDLRDLTRDWKAQLENKKADMVTLVRDIDDDALAEAHDAILQAFLRAAKNMEIEQDGRFVRLRLKEELRDGEKAAVQDGLGVSAADLKAAVQVVEALESGQPAPKSALTHFVGEEAAHWMLLPRASEQDCEKISEHFDALVKRGVPTEHFGAKFRLQQRLAKGCTGQPLPASYRACLLEAEDVASMAECAGPRQPSAARAWKALEGQWKLENVVADEEPEVRDLLEGSLLEFRNAEVAWSGSDLQARTEHAADSPAPDRVSFRWPLAKEPFAMEGEVLSPNEVRLAPDEDGFSIVMKRAELGRSLFEKEEP
jgi:hypothetical protein